MLRPIAVLSIASALLAGVGFWLYPTAPAVTLSAQATAAPSSAAKANAATEQAKRNNQQLQNTQANQLAAPPPLPASLRGTSQDVRLQMDSDGHFKPTSDSLQVFEFYLAGIDEESIASVLQRIHWDLAQQLTEPALSEARDLLKRYLDYRIALMDLPVATSHDIPALQQRLQLTERLRQQHFSTTEYQLFFADDALEDQRMLALLSNPQDSAAVQQSFEQKLSPEQRASRAQITRDGELYAQTEQLRSEGADAATLYQIRAEQLGAQAATALAELDQQRAAWQKRLDQYSAEREKILAAGLSSNDQQQAIEQLLARNFDTTEQVRARALTE